MNVVAITSVPENREEAAGRLAKALGLSLYEARQRLGPGAGLAGPVVVGAFAEKERAGELTEKLNQSGFETILLTDEELQAEAGMPSAKGFALGEGQLIIRLTDGGALSVPYTGIRLIIRGRKFGTSVRTETKVEKKFDITRAVLTQGMILHKKQKTERDITTMEHEGFANLYCGGGLPPVALLENRLLYDSLGPALKPVRAANFAYLVQELRRRCPQARCDERLLNKLAYSSMLGPSLHLEKYPYAATALLVKALLEQKQ